MTHKIPFGTGEEGCINCRFFFKGWLKGEDMLRCAIYTNCMGTHVCYEPQHDWMYILREVEEFTGECWLVPQGYVDAWEKFVFGDGYPPRHPDEYRGIDG